MTDANPDVGDVIRAIFREDQPKAKTKAKAKSKPKTKAPEPKDEPAIAQQVRPPTAKEQEEIDELAKSAAQLQDELKEAIGDKTNRLRNLKKDLLDRLLRHGIKAVRMVDRPAIEVTENRSRKGTRKSITAVLQDEMGEEEGRQRALDIWGKLEWTISQSLSIPPPSPPEMESPY